MNNTTARIRQALNLLRQTWDDSLFGTPVRPARIGYLKTTKNAEAPAPVNAGILDARQATLDTLTAWAELIIAERRLTSRLNRQNPHGLINYLDVHADWLANHPASEDAADELTTAAHQIAAIAEPNRPHTLYIGDCPCGAPLRAQQGREDVTCRACDATDTLGGWVDRLAPTQAGSVTAATLAALIARTYGRVVPEPTIRQWANRHPRHVVKQGRDPQGRTLYDTEAVFGWLDSKGWARW